MLRQPDRAVLNLMVGPEVPIGDLPIEVIGKGIGTQTLLPRETGVSNFIGLLAAADVMVLSWKTISTSSIACPCAMAGCSTGATMS